MNQVGISLWISSEILRPPPRGCPPKNQTQGCILTGDWLEYSCQTVNVNLQARRNLEVTSSLKNVMGENRNCHKNARCFPA